VSDALRVVDGAPTERGSEVVSVTLFEDRAEVVRRAVARLEAGAAWVSVGGATPFLDDRSVQARVSPDAAARVPVRVLAARVVREVHVEAKAGREEIDLREQAEAHARRQVAEADLLLESAAAQQQHAQTLFEQWVRAIGAVPRGIRQGEKRAAWTAAEEHVETAIAHANALADRARRERKRAFDAHVHAVARLEEGRATFTRHEARIEVHLEADAATEVAFEVRYHTPAALWRPEHTAKLTLDDSGLHGTIEIVTWATSWQRTGEAWDDVRAVFSTARPAQHATAPLLGEDLIVARRKTDEEKRNIVVQAREQAIVVAGLDRGARAVEEMPGVDDGGVPQIFEPKDRARLPSDGRPTRVEIARVTVRADVALVVWPERGAVAHLRATATLTEGGPLLAGPAHIARSRADGHAVVAGTSRLDYVGKGEPFELSFGLDDSVRARRKTKDESDTSAVLGTQRRRRTVTVWLSNLSNEPKRVTVVERIPVSEIEGVEVSLVEGRGFRHDAKDGMLECDVSLGPLETRMTTLAFELRATSKVVLPVL